MPKATHFHTAHDTLQTDKKFRPDDEGITTREKQEFQGSEKEKHSESRTEEEFITEQDKNTEG